MTPEQMIPLIEREVASITERMGERYSEAVLRIAYGLNVVIGAASNGVRPHVEIGLGNLCAMHVRAEAASLGTDVETISDEAMALAEMVRLAASQHTGGMH